MEYREIIIDRLLNPTSIDLGEYVINPYAGCEYGCLYCYVRANKVVRKRAEEWGSYVDIKLNAAEILEQELSAKKPLTVLLGSTTECFQPAERKYRIMKSILEVLNQYRINYVILTRSPLIIDYCNQLTQGFCKNIYFTVNDYDPQLKQLLEPSSPEFRTRHEAINALIDYGLPVIPYISPILPSITNLQNIFTIYRKSSHMEFEFLNLRLAMIEKIIAQLSTIFPTLQRHYQLLQNDERYFNDFWINIHDTIKDFAGKTGKSYKVHAHNFGGYFQNTYR